MSSRAGSAGTTATTFVELLRQTGDRVPDRAAFICDGEVLTYRELWRRAGALADSLRRQGISAGDVVAGFLPNGTDFCTTFAAAARLGAAFLPVNVRLGAGEVAYILEHSRTRALVSTARVDGPVNYLERLGRTASALATARRPDADGLPDLQVVHVFGRDGIGPAVKETGPGATRAEGPRPEAETAELDTSLLLYTSGTTARPKGCPLHNRGVVNAGMAMAARLGLADGTVLWNPCPMFHCASIIPLVGSLGRGGTFVSTSHFEPASAIAAIEAHGATVAYPAFANFVQDMLRDPSYRPERLAQVERILCVGPPAVVRDIQAALPGATLLNCYGITEACGTVAVSSPDDPLEVRLTTTGVPREGLTAQIRSVDTGEGLSAGHPGQLWLKGPDMVTRYLGDESHPDVFDEHGWFFTGDLAALDDGGRIAYLGRIKDMLKVGGENVGALEIESVLVSYPGVLAASVIAVPDAKYGEVPVGFVETDGSFDGTASDLVEFASRELARFKVPRDIVFVTEWPMSATKIQKFRLRESYLDAHGGAASGRTSS